MLKTAGFSSLDRINPEAVANLVPVQLLSLFDIISIGNLDQFTIDWCKINTRNAFQVIYRTMARYVHLHIYVHLT